MLLSRHTRRREFITLLGSAVAWPATASAQQAERLRQIAVLTGQLETDIVTPVRLAAFRQGLQIFGWEEGRNVQITYRHASSESERLRAAAQELVATGPDVIVVQSNPALAALRQIDRTIPVVFVQVGDPVGSGFVDSLARPGGNLTGFTTMEPEMGGKWLELLKEAAPAIAQVASHISVPLRRRPPRLRS